MALNYSNLCKFESKYSDGQAYKHTNHKFYNVKLEEIYNISNISIFLQLNHKNDQKISRFYTNS